MFTTISDRMLVLQALVISATEPGPARADENANQTNLCRPGAADRASEADIILRDYHAQPPSLVVKCRVGLLRLG